jgi:hypothetical protein
MMRDDRPRVVVSVDALDARYHQASIVAENGGWDLSSLDREAIRKLVVGQRLVVDKTRVRMPIRSEAVAELSVRHDHRRSAALLHPLGRPGLLGAARPRVRALASDPTCGAGDDR